MKDENTGTKPNMAKFLKQYVRSVRALASGALGFYPRFEYKVQRVFVQFVDGHELIFYPGRPKPENRYVCTYRYEDVALGQADLQALDKFFGRLF